MRGDPVIVIPAEDLLPPGAKLPAGACRQCGGCGEMTTTGRWNLRATEPCNACGGTGKRSP